MPIVPPPQPSPSVHIVSNDQAPARHGEAGFESALGDLWNVTPPQPEAELRICLANGAEADRIAQLPGAQRDKMIENLVKSCLSQLGEIPKDIDVSIRTETSRESGIILIITFLGLALLAVSKIAEAVGKVAETGSAWAKIITGLPAVYAFIRRATRLEHEVTFNEPLLIGLVINHSHENGNGSAMPIDFCSIEPIRTVISESASAQKRSDTFGVLTCDKLPKPTTLRGYVISKSGRLLATGSTSHVDGRRWGRQASPIYHQLRNAVPGLPEVDIDHADKIAAMLPRDHKEARKSELRVGVFSRVHGLVSIWPGKYGNIEIDQWPPMAMVMMQGDTLLTG